MSNLWKSLAGRYKKALRSYLVEEHEAALQQAYEIGRRAVSRRMGVLDMAKLHHAVLRDLLRGSSDEACNARVLGAAETFYLELVSPFEVIHRGFGEANVRLRHLIAELEKQNTRLRCANQDLENEIAERKRAEEALRLSEEKVRLFISNVRDYAMIIVTPKGRVATWNPGAERIMGYREEQVVGESISIFYPPEEVKPGKVPPALKLAARDGRVEDEGWRLRKDGSRFWANTVLTAIRDEKGRLRGFGKITRDMTERKAAEEALRQSEEHHRRLFHEAQIMEQNLRNLSNQILHVQEEERKRMSRELHDEVGQALTAINVNLAVLNGEAGALGAGFKQRLADTQRLVSGTAETVHRFARELRPAMLDDLGLIPALRSFSKGFQERTGITVTLRAELDESLLDGEKKTALYRVLQESLTNVAKHARASRAEVAIWGAERKVCLEVRDNGAAFAVGSQAAAARGKRLGLLGMEERVRLVKGEFDIQSQPGHGTTVRVRIPFSSD